MLIWKTLYEKQFRNDKHSESTFPYALGHTHTHTHTVASASKLTFLTSDRLLRSVWCQIFAKTVSNHFGNWVSFGDSRQGLLVNLPIRFFGEHLNSTDVKHILSILILPCILIVLKNISASESTGQVIVKRRPTLGNIFVNKIGNRIIRQFSSPIGVSLK